MEKNWKLSVFLFSVFCFFVLLIGLAFGGYNVLAYDGTGHDDFPSITFTESNCRLMNDYSETEVNKLYKRINKKRFGWATHYMCIDEKIDYDGIVIFSRSNKTSRSINFEYSLKETITTTTDVTVKGAVSAKVSGTIKKINTTLGGNIDVGAEYEKKKQESQDSKTTINIVIYPYTKLTFVQTGEAYLTNAVSKYFFFGVMLKKGIWERIDVATTYYELREEILDE